MRETFVRIMFGSPLAIADIIITDLLHIQHLRQIFVCGIFPFIVTQLIILMIEICIKGLNLSTIVISRCIRIPESV